MGTQTANPALRQRTSRRNILMVTASSAALPAVAVELGDSRLPPAPVAGGELANVGTATAISNAVYHATGIRVRKLPIRIEDVLEA